MPTWFGPVDALLRTAAALAAYFSVRWLKGEVGFDPPFLVGEGITVLAALLVSGLASQKLWRWPRLTLVWAVGDKVVDQPTFEIRAGDERRRRVVSHQVCASEPSIFSWLVLRRLSRDHTYLALRVVPEGAFYLTEDLSLETVQFIPEAYGFKHTLPDLGESGLIALTRVEWEPARPGLPVRCSVRWRLEVVGKQGRLARRLVHLDACVKNVELGD